MHCSHCGARIPESHRNQLQPARCPTCRRIHYYHPRVTAGVLVAHDEALLLVQRKEESGAIPDCWSLPVGSCEAGESLRVTARKAAEAMGFQVEVGQLVEAYPFEDDSACNGLLLVYEASIRGGELHRSGGSSRAFGFFGSGEIPKPLCGNGHDQAIESWRNRSHLQWQPGSPMYFCPHCSRPLVEQVAFGRLRSVCLACGFVDLRGPKVGVSLLITDPENKLLLIRRAIEPGKDQWCLPSGFVDWDESPEEAAVRECAEETGLAVTSIRLFEVGHYTDDFRGPGINLTYRARVEDGCLEPGDDAAEARYFAPTELPAAEDVAFASHRGLLERLREA